MKRRWSGWFGDRRHHLLPLLLVLAALVPFYGPLAGRGFTSEDFLLLRVLRERPPWADPAALLAGPWLGIEVVRFYRPVATVLLALEAALFGARPWAYNLVHLAVHGANAVLVWHLAAGWVRQGAAASPAGGAGPHRPTPNRACLAPAVTTLLFVLHPLHPNAVSWIASFATLFATTFLLLCWLAWRRWGHGGGPGWLLAALGAFLLALGSYEAAVVMPLLLLLGDLLAPPMSERRPWRRRLAGWLPFALLIAGYLVLRQAIFGRVVGGYTAYAERWSAETVGMLAGDAFTALFRLLHPVYAGPPPVWAPLAVVAWLLVLPLLALLVAGRGWRREVGLWSFGWLWVLLALAPFAFQPFVPGNGRYAYLASVGLALALGRLPAVAAGGARRRRLARWLAAALPALLLVAWCTLLFGYARQYHRAGELAQRVSRSLAAWDAGAPRRAFVAGHPLFLHNAAGVPVAQVLRYGLADAVRPPFAATALEVYPLPPMAPGGWVPLRQAFPAALLLRWDGEAGRFREVAADGGPAEGMEAAGAPVRRRLIVAARGNPAVVELAPGQDRQGALPREFVTSMARLYDGEIYAWVEERAGAGGEERVVAWSPPRPVAVPGLGSTAPAPGAGGAPRPAAPPLPPPAGSGRGRRSAPPPPPAP